MPSENGAVQTGDDSALLLHHMQDDPGLDDEPWENQTLNAVHWLPTEPEQCHKALRHYAADVNVNDLELGAVTSMSSVFTVQQPGPQEDKGVYKPCEARCSGHNGTPSSRRLFWALVLAVVSTVACGVIPGAAAVVMVNKAKRRHEEGQYTESRQWVDYAFAIIAVSVFACIPIYIYLIAYQNHLF